MQKLVSPTKSCSRLYKYNTDYLTEKKKNKKNKMNELFDLSDFLTDVALQASAS